MKTVISGASGFIGSALVPFLTGHGYQVARLARSKLQPGAKDIHWDPSAGYIAVPALEGCEAAVHLAGENITEGRWTSESKARIRNSRAEGTHLLAGALSALQNKPKAHSCASA